MSSVSVPSPDLPIERATGLRRVLANAVSLLLAWVLPRLFTAGAIVAAARVLGVSRFGHYGTAAAFAVILSIVATLGMQPLLIREMARDPAAAARWLRASHIVKTGTNVLMLILLVMLAGMLGYPPEVRSAALMLGVSYALAAYVENLAAWFQATERMQVWTQASAAAGLITGGLGVALVLLTQSVLWFCFAAVLGQFAALLWLALRMPRELHRGEANRQTILSLLRALAPFAAGFIALTLHSKIDVLMLARWWSSLEVGLYTAAHKFIDIVQALAIVAAAAVYPRLARSTNARWAATRLLDVTLLAAVLAGGALWLARDAVIALLFGSGYQAAGKAVGLLAIAVVPLAVNIAGGYVLAAVGAMGRVAALYAGATVLKIVLNVMLVPSGGTNGTALSLLLTEIVLAGGMLFVLRAEAKAVPRMRTVAGAFVAVGFCAALHSLHLTMGGFAMAAVFAVVSIVLMNAIGSVSSADRALLRAALRPGRAAARGET